MPRGIWVIAIAGLVYLQYRLWLGPGGYLDARELQARVDSAVEVNREMQVRNRVIEAQIHSLEHDPKAIEYHARTDLGMLKPGETFFLIVN